MSIRPALRARLLELEATFPVEQRLANDPLRFVHRYRSDPDREIAGWIASTLAYGRVSLFAPVVEALLRRADERGGPLAWITGFRSEDEDALRVLYYRFHRPDDLLLLLAGLRTVIERHGSLGALVVPLAKEDTIGPALSRMVHVLREAAAQAHPTAATFAELPRGARYSLVDPASGSASKRLLMYARWMVRRDGVDLGVWRHVAPSLLVMPVDTHVHRIARMTGLLSRRTADWRAALELTEVLRSLDPDDPVRFDFALAHLGISQGCRGVRDDVCSTCALRPVCAAHRTVG